MKIKALKALTTKLLSHKLIRFFLVGVLNTVFGYSVFAFCLLFLQLNYPIALLISTVLGVMFNFKTIGLIVFNNSNNRLIFRFIAIYAICYCINVFVLFILKKLILNPIYAQAMLALPVALLAYILNKRFVYISETRP